jgi:hypothetical protein
MDYLFISTTNTILPHSQALAITYGSLVKDLFSVGKRDQIIVMEFIIGAIALIPLYLLHRFLSKAGFDFSYINTAIIAGSLANLAHATHSFVLTYYCIGFFSWFWLRKYESDVG